MATVVQIGTFHSPFKEKFGIPRQAGIVSDLPGYISFEKPYNSPEAIRGLEDFDYIWIIWQSAPPHSNAQNEKNRSAKEGAEANSSIENPVSPTANVRVPLTVRPPRLGGNKRMGVFATRSPFRPNPLCMSCVRIDHIDTETNTIHVLGADILDGTPILDIKPYIPYSDSHPEARGGFTDQTQWSLLQVNITAEAERRLTECNIPADIIRQLIAQDPRPHFHHDPQRVYGMSYEGWNVKFTVDGTTANVVDVERRKRNN